MFTEHCIRTEPTTITNIYLAAHAVIFLSYTSIPLAIFYFRKHRRTLPEPQLAYWFISFILLCGLTHLMAVLTFFFPWYGAEVVVLTLTSLVSGVVAIGLVKVMPKLLTITTHQELVQLNGQLRRLMGDSILQETRMKEEIRKGRIVEAAYDSASYPIIVADGEGTILTWNQKAMEMLGWSKPEMIGNNVSVIIPMRYQDGHHEAIRNTSQTGVLKHGGKPIHVAAITKAGVEVPVKVFLNRIFLDDQILISAVLQRTEESDTHVGK